MVLARVARNRRLADAWATRDIRLVARDFSTLLGAHPELGLALVRELAGRPERTLRRVLERIGEGIGSFQALCDIVGEAFFAFSMITGARRVLGDGVRPRVRMLFWAAGSFSAVTNPAFSALMMATGVPAGTAKDAARAGGETARSRTNRRRWRC